MHKQISWMTGQSVRRDGRSTGSQSKQRLSYVNTRALTRSCAHSPLVRQTRPSVQKTGWHPPSEDVGGSFNPPCTTPRITNRKITKKQLRRRHIKQWCIFRVWTGVIWMIYEVLGIIRITYYWKPAEATENQSACVFVYAHYCEHRRWNNNEKNRKAKKAVTILNSETRGSWLLFSVILEPEIDRKMQKRTILLNRGFLPPPLPHPNPNPRPHPNPNPNLPCKWCSGPFRQRRGHHIGSGGWRWGRGTGDPPAGEKKKRNASRSFPCWSGGGGVATPEDWLGDPYSILSFLVDWWGVVRLEKRFTDWVSASCWCTCLLGGVAWQGPEEISVLMKIIVCLQHEPPYHGPSNHSSPI